jgi:hypothetical protein
VPGVNAVVARVTKRSGQQQLQHDAGVRGRERIQVTDSLADGLYYFRLRTVAATAQRSLERRSPFTVDTTAPPAPV